MSTIYEIADHVLASSPYGLSNRELQKVLYFAQGFYLAQTGEHLFSEDLQAWRHGPCHGGLYYKFREYGWNSIGRPAVASLVPIRPEVAAFIAAVTLTFSAVGQSNLIEFSHADVPWASKFIPDANVRLSKEDIRDYFRNFHSIDDYLEVAKTKLEFREFIKSRAQYLATLPSIGDAWISGQSVAPSLQACATASAFLSGIERHMFASSAKPRIPKIIMGPIPSGGVSIEINSTIALYLHFHNGGRVEVETETQGNFTDFEISSGQFEENFSHFYRMVHA